MSILSETKKHAGSGQAGRLSSPKQRQAIRLEGSVLCERPKGVSRRFVGELSGQRAGSRSSVMATSRSTKTELRKNAVDSTAIR